MRRDRRRPSIACRSTCSGVRRACCIPPAGFAETVALRLLTGIARAACGDGIVDSDEQCDHGTANGHDACCSTTCEAVDLGINTSHPQAYMSCIYSSPSSYPLPCS
jgi:hypothetical protein